MATLAAGNYHRPMLTPDERAEFTELASAYLAAVKQIELHRQAVASERAAAGSLLVTLMAGLMTKYPVSGFTCHDYLFALIPHDGKKLLYVSPLGTICEVDAERTLDHSHTSEFTDDFSHFNSDPHSPSHGHFLDPQRQVIFVVRELSCLVKLRVLGGLKHRSKLQ